MRVEDRAKESVATQRARGGARAGTCVTHESTVESGSGLDPAALTRVRKREEEEEEEAGRRTCVCVWRTGGKGERAGRTSEAEEEQHASRPWRAERAWIELRSRARERERKRKRTRTAGARVCMQDRGQGRAGTQRARARQRRSDSTGNTRLRHLGRIREVPRLEQLA